MENMLENNVYGRYATFFKNCELKEADEYIKRVFPNAEFYIDYEHALVFERIREDEEIDLDYHTVINEIAYNAAFTNSHKDLVEFYDEVEIKNDKEKVLLQSRPEALNDMMDLDLQNQKGGYNNGWNDCLFMFIDIIKKQPKVGEWIPVSERLPEEHDSIFAKLYGTDKWSDALWRTQSKEVLVTLEYEDGIRTVKSSHTTDGKWSIEKKTTLSKFKVVAWMELLKPYEGETKWDF